AGFFIVATNAWMQHPGGYWVVGGRVELTRLWALVTNPYVRWQYPHAISGPLVTASRVMAGTGAFYLRWRRQAEAGRIVVRAGVVCPWRRTLLEPRGMLWLLLLGAPFPCSANEAGWVVAEVGRQPWTVYGLQRVSDASSLNVTAGMTYFTLFGFMGLYLALGL